jgi:Ricin-type beta-trefoil lectin domain-like
MKNLSIAFALVVGSVAGCGELPDGTDDQGVTEESSALASNLTTSEFKLHNYQTGLCLGVAAGTPNTGTALVTWPCDNSANQTWIQTSKISGDRSAVHLQNSVAYNRCMTLKGASYSAGTNGAPGIIDVCQDPWTLSETYGWKPISAGTDNTGHACYRFQREGSTKVIGVSGGKTAWGTPAILWDDFNSLSGHPDQFWCVY